MSGLSNTGGRYNPRRILGSLPAQPTRRTQWYHTAVWTGSEMIVWGGERANNLIPLDSGGRYNPSTNSWTATSLGNAPDPPIGSHRSWTGDNMIIWGGGGDIEYRREILSRYRSLGRYQHHQCAP